MVSTATLQRSTDVGVVHWPTALSIAHSLLVSKDSAAVEQITNALQTLAITTEVCSDVAAARQILHTRKFDVVAVDFDMGEGSPGLL